MGVMINEHLHLIFEEFFVRNRTDAYALAHPKRMRIWVHVEMFDSLPVGIAVREVVKHGLPFLSNHERTLIAVLAQENCFQYYRLYVILLLRITHQNVVPCSLTILK